MFWGRWFVGRYFILVLVGVSHLLSSLSLFIHSLFFLSNCCSLKEMGERDLGFVLFISLLQAVSLWCFSSVGLAFQLLGWCGPASAPGVECRGGAWARGGACPRSAAARRISGWRLQALPVATVAVARAGCLWALCSSRRIPFPSSASSLPQERETQRRSALELWCLNLGALREKAKCSQVQPVSQSCPGTPAVWLHLLGGSTAEPFPEPARRARGESGLHDGERGDQDTDDGRTDLARGLALSPPSGYLWVYSKRRRAELRRSSETFPVAPGRSSQGAAGFAEGR